MLNMWTTHNIAARTLIWLAVIAIPVQSLSASSCGCSSSKSCCQDGPRASSCCDHLDKTSATKTCCGKPQNAQDSPCHCGANCPCGKGRQPKPTMPPVEKNTPEKVAIDSVSMVTPPQSQATQRHRDALVALNSCVSLCRFTI